MTERESNISDSQSVKTNSNGEHPVNFVEALRKSETKYRTLIKGIPDLILINDPNGTYLDVHVPDNNMLHVPSETFLGKRVADILPAPITEQFTKAFAEALSTNNLQEIGYELQTPDGKEKYFEARIVPSIDGTLTSIVRDITERKINEEALQKSEEKYRKLVEQSQDIIFTVHPDGNIDFLSPSWTNHLGYTIEQATGELFVQFIHPDDVGQCTTALEQIINTKKQLNIEYRVKHIDGSWQWHSTNVVPQIDNKGNVIGMQGIARDITEKKLALEEIERLTYRDHLTGLYNRRFFEENIKIVDTARQLPLSVIMSDLNNLKLVNDTYGHSEGDKLLVEISKVMRDVCRAEDIVARLGGDEFGILFPKTTTEEAEQIMQRIQEECGKKIIGDNLLSASMGVATKIKVEETIVEVIKEAEKKMYLNKAEHKRTASSTVIFEK